MSINYLTSGNVDIKVHDLEVTGTFTSTGAGGLTSQYKPQQVMYDSFGTTYSADSENDNIWVQQEDNIITGTTPNNTDATITIASGYLEVGGTAGVEFWSGKGLRSSKAFTYTNDYDIQVDMYIDNNSGTDSAQAIEMYSSSSYNTGIYMSKTGGLQKYTNIGGVQTVVNVNATNALAYEAKTFKTFVLKKRSQNVLVYVNDVFYTAYQFNNPSNFYVRLMGYARAMTDAPIFRWKNFSITQYPVVSPTYSIASSPLLSGSGSGFDSVFVKDPEVVLGPSGVYYMYYSGWNGSAFSSGVVPLGTDLSAPVVGTRTQLVLSGGATDNGAPTAFWDGTNMWLYMQTSAAPGASIQILKSTTTGSTTAFTKQGTAFAVDTDFWINGAYDACIVKQAINGVYYLYFTATASTYNTAGYTRTQGLATATSLAGPWTVQGQVRLAGSYDNITYGMEAPNVFYDSGTSTFHMQATGGSLGNQEILMNYYSWDGRTFYISHDVAVLGGGSLAFNFLAAGSGCYIVSGSTLFIYYQAQPVAGGAYKVGYASVSLSPFVQRALLLPL